MRQVRPYLGFDFWHPLTRRPWELLDGLIQLLQAEVLALRHEDVEEVGKLLSHQSIELDVHGVVRHHGALVHEWDAVAVEGVP